MASGRRQGSAPGSAAAGSSSGSSNQADGLVYATPLINDLRGWLRCEKCMGVFSHRLRNEGIVFVKLPPQATLPFCAREERTRRLGPLACLSPCCCDSAGNSYGICCLACKPELERAFREHQLPFVCV